MVPGCLGSVNGQKNPLIEKGIRSKDGENIRGVGGDAEREKRGGGEIEESVEGWGGEIQLKSTQPEH